MDASTFCAEVLPRLIGSLTLYCGDRQVGEELGQEAMVRALERWERVEDLAYPEAWVFRVGFNLAKSSRRRRAAERRAIERYASRLRVSRELPDPAAAVAVRQAVQTLPPRQRAAVIARFYAGLDIHAAATALGCAEGTVKALTHKAIERLRQSGLIDDDPEVTADARPFRTAT